MAELKKVTCSVSVIHLVTAVLVLGSALVLPSLVKATTNPTDVQALQTLYSSLNSPPQLKNWNSTAVDPCGQSWLGVTCEGPAVVSIEIPGLRLNGTIYALGGFTSLRKFDVSDNNVHDTIPYSLPMNLTSLNLAGNNITGTLPYSFSSMSQLDYLNFSQNSLSQNIGDVFSNLAALKTLDLSFNNFSGVLPNFSTSLTNLSSLYLQNNQLSGSLDLLRGLPLTTLNVANNNFSGWIPPEVSSVPTFIFSGNSFANPPAASSPPTVPTKPHDTTPTKPHDNHSHHGSHSTRGGYNGEDSNSHKRFISRTFLVIIVGSSLALLVVLLALIFCIRKSKKKNSISRVSTPRSQSIGKSSRISTAKVEMQEQKATSTATITELKPPPAEALVAERSHGRTASQERIRAPITVASYSVASLQTATGSFSQEYLIGEGSFGRVYRGEFPNGKIMAVKKIDNTILPLQEEEDFLEAVATMSRLRHPNIVALTGYCSEHGQHLLAYEYIGNGSLHDMLHFAEDNIKTLSWNARVRVALGTARALEYLHEVCSPSIVHRNFKSANILLDEDLNPHLSDCGLAALTPNPERQAPTQMVGSFGYSAPEFTLSGTYTIKSDVYSFGVVMLELLTGRKPLDSSRVRSEQSLVRWATPQLHDIDALAKMVDPALNGMYPAKSLSRFADIIALCIQPEPEFRPPMSEVVQALVRLVQRASMGKRHPSDESGFTYRTPDHDTIDI